MAATAQTVRNVDLAELLGGVDDERIECILSDEVSCYMSRSQFGDCADLAEALIAAHLITIALRGGSGPAGPVTAESAGGLSRSYASATITSQSEFWASTSFGQRYLQIARTRLTTPIAMHIDGANSVNGALV